MEENTSLTAAAGDQNTGSAVPKPTTAISSSSTGGGSLLVTDNAAGQVSTNEGQDQATREISKKQALEGGLEEAAMPASTDARTNITHSKEAAPNSDTNDTSRPDSLSNQPSPGPPAAPIERSPLDCGNLQLLLEACVPSSKPTDEETYSTAAVQPQQQYPQDEESQPTEGISANPSKTIDAQQQPVRDPVRPEPSEAPKSPVRHPQPHISQSMSSSKGGFFDDAAERGRIFDDASPRPATSSSPPAKKAKLSEGTVPSPPKCGGIFDDAEDDDMDFEAPTYEPQASVKIPKKDAPLPSLPSSFDSASIGLPPPPPKSRMDVHNSALERPLAPKNNSSGVAPGNHAIKSSLDNASSFSSSAAAPIVDVSQKKDMSKEKQPAKKKKPTKPVKRVLVARKERDAAVLLLAKADDLVRVIAPEHSTFLGEELWIFTIGQLEYVLDQSFPSESGLAGWVAANQLNKSPTRADLLRKVAMSKLVSECAKGTTESSKQVKDDDAIKGRPNLDAEKNSKETAVDSMHQGAGVDEKATAAAEAILKGWKEAIEEWKMKNEKVPLKEKFLLDGPISCIFPPVARNFFASMTPPLKSLYEFLSLKKTETGAVIALCVAWRKQCGLPDATPLAIAKYLIGLSFRTEAAVSVPPPGAFARRWMSEPIVVLTGAAREFLVEERGIVSAAEFLETRTKELALHLAEWRDRRGLPPLKGSGKVAMVSGWKAGVKEAVDVETGSGKVLKGVDLQALVEQAEKVPIVKEEGEKTQPAAAKSQPQSQPPPEFTFDPRIPGVDAALHSPKFLEEALDPKYFAVFQSVGVRTPVELFSAVKRQGSPLAIAVAKILPDPTNFELTIFDLCQIVRKKLSGIRRVNSNKRKPDDDEHEGAPATAKAKLDNTLLNGPPKEAVSRAKKEELQKKDPFYSLSAVTQTFLASMGIATAEGFLSTRTTDLSNAFVEWRAANDMPVLKGLGAIASVSGWKAQVRKIAKERGMEELALMVPEGSASYTPGKKRKSKDGSATNKKLNRAKLESGSSADPGKRMIAHPGVLFGKPSQRILVESTNDSKITFSFDLSIRKASSAPGIGLFVTYLGGSEVAEPRTIVNEANRQIRRLELMGKTGSMIEVSYPVLNKAVRTPPKGADDTTGAVEKYIPKHFSAAESGCGMIELTDYDVWPLPRQGEAELAFKDVERFISDLTIGKAALDGDDSDSTSNILVGKGESGKRHFFLFLQEPMEKGQTVELKFPSSLGCYIKDEDGAPVGIWRQQIDGIIARLSSDGLRTLSNFISKLVYDKIDNKLGLLANQDGSASGDPHIDLLTNPDELRNLIISRRRVHWAVLRIKERLKAIEEKGGRRDSGNGVSIPDTESNKSILWSPQLVTKLMRHPAWDDSIVRAIEDEVFEELQPELESSGVVSSHCRKKWCPLAKDIFEKFLGCLVKLSTLTDASNSQDALILDLRNLALKFAQTLVGIQSSGTKEEVNKLSLAFEAEDKFQGNLPRAEDVVRMATAQAYQDAVGLCNDAPMFETILPEKLQVVATQLPDKESSVDSVDADAPKPSFARVAFRTIEDVEACKASINHKWYIKYQLVDILDALISTATNLCGVREPFVSQARAAIRQAVKESPGYDLSISSDAVKPSIDIPLALPSKLGASDYKPHSFQLFLGLVWPSLRSAGWRLDAGESPSDISFIPPGQKSSGRRSDKRSRMLKQERTKSRIKLAKAANDIGLGFVPKLTKRFFVKIGEMNAGGTGGSSSVTAKKALDRFLAKIESELSEENQDSHKRAKVVVEQIKTSFDELFPMLLENGEDDSILLDANTSPSEYAGCEYLARLLLVLPSILYQAGLAMRLIDDTTIVIKELADFLAINHEELFDKRFHPESEVYIGDNTVKPVVASRLEKLRLISSNSASEHVELDEAILPEDRPNLTDFVETVMEQVIPCRATQNDIIRKNRRIGVGAIGLVCRHCLGSNGEGRYFFSSIDSITTASTVIEKHIQKCPAVSAEIKDRVVECRSRHAEQRKGLAPGAQAAYFLRLWERLRSSKVKDTAATLLVLEANEDRENLKEDCGGASDEFTDHVSVLKYLSETPLWSEKSEIAEALGQYYDSLEIGGRIYSTDAMPKGFSSEWLLEQVTGSAHTTMG